MVISDSGGVEKLSEHCSNKGRQKGDFKPSFLEPVLPLDKVEWIFQPKNVVGKYFIKKQATDTAYTQGYEAVDAFLPEKDAQGSIVKFFIKVFKEVKEITAPTARKISKTFGTEKLFVDELRKLKKLTEGCEYIVKIVDYGYIPKDKDDKERYYIVEEFCDGPTLVECEDYSHAQMLPIFLDVGYALKFIHRLSLIHQDIKGRNIMVGGPGEFSKLSDFGTCQSVYDSRSRKYGSVLFQSPEHIREETINWQTDMWLLGVLIYTYLGGEYPFFYMNDFPNLNQEEKEKRIKEIKDIINSDKKIVPLKDAVESKGKEIPSSLDKLVMNMLGRDKTERPLAKCFCRELNRIIKRHYMHGGRYEQH